MKPPSRRRFIFVAVKLQAAHHFVTAAIKHNLQKKKALLKEAPFLQSLKANSFFPARRHL
jgi:hypothetical protein